jgi:hypothetical protein
MRPLTKKGEPYYEVHFLTLSYEMTLRLWTSFYMRQLTINCGAFSV